MNLPFTVLSNLNEHIAERWEIEFEQYPHRDRTVEEGIWRRTQEPENASESGWGAATDARRRLVHYNFKFGVVRDNADSHLALRSVYLYQSVSAPVREVRGFEERVLNALSVGGWAQEAGEWSRGDLRCVAARLAEHPEDALARRARPRGYASLDITLTSRPQLMAPDRRRLPWEILLCGIRHRDTRGIPDYVATLAELANYTPFQVEMGCGASTEAHIPPLHHLHELYAVTDRATNRFIFAGPSDTLLTDVLTHPEGELHKRSQMMVACLTAEPTDAHRVLADLARRGLVLTPIITNNFDGLHLRVGLPECYVRRYDQSVPDIPIHPDARALLIVGSHADRRKVQARLRERGLKIFFLDPEGFKEGNTWRPYLIEGASHGDTVCSKGAAAGLLDFASICTPAADSRFVLVTSVRCNRASLNASNGSEAAVASCWETAVAANPSLFNGSVVSPLETAHEDGACTILWRHSDYAHYLYARKQGASGSALPGTIFVSAAMITEGGEVVLGRMAAGTSTPDIVQLPGGGLSLAPDVELINTGHLMAGVIEEVEEELGLIVSTAELELIGVIERRTPRDVGIVFMIRGRTRREIEESFEALRVSRHGVTEFSCLLFVDPTASLEDQGVQPGSTVDYLGAFLSCVASTRALARG